MCETWISIRCYHVFSLRLNFFHTNKIYYLFLTQSLFQTFDQLQLQSLVNVHLVEVSDSLSKLQAERLCVNVQHHDLKSRFSMSGETKSGVKVFWYKTVQDIDMTHFSLVVAHEFFDALPIHKFQVGITWFSIILILLFYFFKILFYGEKRNEKFKSW